MKWASILNISFIIYSLLLTSCGKSSSSSKVVETEFVTSPLYFVAKIKPLNKRLSSKINGFVKVHLQRNQIWVQVKLDGDKDGVEHPQYIHTRETCPSDRDDVNRDSWIDVEEVFKTSGPFLIPLDQRLDSQYGGIEKFPFSKKDGSYYYSVSASIRFFKEDLQSVDPDPYDQMTKLFPGEPLNIHGRTIVIYGIPEATESHKTMAVYQNYPRQTYIPIACGEFSIFTEQEP